MDSASRGIDKKNSLGKHFLIVIIQNIKLNVFSEIFFIDFLKSMYYKFYIYHFHEISEITIKLMKLHCALLHSSGAWQPKLPTDNL